ncbi:MAG: sigma 54-interacting transcriptional regulator [Myxococcota bacterium]
MAGTLSRHRPRRRRGPRLEPHWYLLHHCDRPHARPVRYPLRRFDRVALGRGTAGASVRERQLHIEIDDPWLSAVHAELVRVGARWIISDRDSKNGVLVAGERVAQAELVDGQIIELGRTLWMYREQPESAGAVKTLGTTPDLERGAFTTLSPTLRAAFDALAKVASSEISVVLRGETGTGKEVMARAIHVASGREGAFVAVNCGGLPDNLVHSELFGYRRGAFSGADEDRPGLIRSAHGGTLFLDEIGDMAPASQTALLRVLQEREVTPLGATRAVPVDLRVIAATHRPIETMTGDGRFREDLYARLSGFVLTLPPLRERREDLGWLVSRLLGPDRPHVAFQPEAARALFQHPWPRNVRELSAVLARAVVLADDEPIDVEHLGLAPASAPAEKPARAWSPEDEALRADLIRHLERHEGNVSAIARDLEKDRKQIRRWLQRFDLDAARYRRR